MVMPPAYPCSSRNRSNTRLDVCFCFFGTLLSASRIASMIGVKGSSFGRLTGFVRRYPGGTENRSVLSTVRRSIPKTRAASRRLIPSINTACRTRLYKSTPFTKSPRQIREPISGGVLLRPQRDNLADHVVDYCTGVLIGSQREIIASSKCDNGSTKIASAFASRKFDSQSPLASSASFPMFFASIRISPVETPKTCSARTSRFFAISDGSLVDCPFNRSIADATVSPML